MNCFLDIIGILASNCMGYRNTDTYRESHKQCNDEICWCSSCADGRQRQITAELTDNNHVCGIEAQAKEACKNNWQSIRNDNLQQGAFKHDFVQPFHTNTNLGI